MTKIPRASFVHESTTPPPPYDDAINQKSWVSRIGQTITDMRQSMHDTQDTTHSMKDDFSHLEKANRWFIESLEKSTNPKHIDNNDEENEDEDDDLSRITESLQQLIEQAQMSLKTSVAIHGPTCMTVYRSVSCLHLADVYCENSDGEEEQLHHHDTHKETEKDIRRHKLVRASTLFPESSSLRDQEERYLDNQWRLTTAMQELVDTVSTCQEEDMDTTVDPPPQHQLQARLRPSSIYVASTPRRRGKRKYNVHHHHHHYHNAQQIINVHFSSSSSTSPVSLSHIILYAWTFIRATLSDTHKQKQQRAVNNNPAPHVSPSSYPYPPPSLLQRFASNTYMKQQKLQQPLLSPSPVPQKQKQEQQEQPKLSLSRPNLFRLMLFVTMLLFSSVHPTSKNVKKSRQMTALERHVGHFLFTSPDQLPVSAWIQRSSLVIYTLAFL